jgi:serine/threonine-protein kinase
VYPNKTSGTCPTDGTLLVTPQEYAAIRSDPLIGTTMAGRFRIVGRVGTGGMGTVYRAEQVGLARQVALKVLKQEASYDRETVARFQREAKAMSMLLHANTVRVFDFGEDPSGHLYLAMELLEGELLTARSERDGKLDVIEAIEIVRQILRSLSEAHSKGLIHRDLKPDNIYLARIEGHPVPVVKVLDFGIAKVFRDDAKPMDQLETQAGTVFGTPRYMSPEQAQGKALDPRSDLYSVGVLLYQLLVGHPPFMDDDAVVVMAKHIRDAPEPPRKAASDRPIPPTLERVVLRALAKDPKERYSTADELETALVECVPDVAEEVALRAAGRRSGDVFFVAGRPVPRTAVWIGASVVAVSLLGAIVVMATGSSGASAHDDVVVRSLAAPPTTTPVVPAAPPSVVPLPTRTVLVSSEPPGAEIWQGDLRVGTAPQSFAIDPSAPAPAALELRLAGHDPATVDLATASDITTVTLAPHRAIARTTPPPGSRVRDHLPTTVAPPSSAPPATTTASQGGYERFD